MTPKARSAVCGQATALAVIAGVLAVSACTLEPDYHRPGAPVASAYPDGPGYRSAEDPQINRSGANGATPAPLSADLGWRDFLRDDRLQRLVELALRNNRDLRVAMLNIESARAQYDIERSALFPSLNLNGSAARGRGSLSTYSTGTTVSKAFEGYASASWELDLFGRNRSLTHAAMDSYLATVQAHKGAQILLVAEVATQYLTLLAADESLEVTARSLKIALESYRLTKLQFDNGTGSELDLRSAEGVLEQARAQLAAQQRARAQAENALVVLVGEPLPADLPPGHTLGEQILLADIPAGLPSDLLNRRPDIAQAEDQLRAANASIGAARADFFPTISLTGAAGYVSPVLGRLFHSGNSAWGVSPSAAVPIFSGGLQAANLAQVKVQHDIAVAQYEKTVQTAFQEVADGLSARATYRDQFDATDRQAQALRRRLELAQLRFKAGVDSYLTLLVAQNDLNTAELARVSTSLARHSNLVTLYKALGGGWVENTGVEPR